MQQDGEKCKEMVFTVNQASHTSSTEELIKNKKTYKEEKTTSLYSKLFKPFKSFRKLSVSKPDNKEENIETKATSSKRLRFVSETEARNPIEGLNTRIREQIIRRPSLPVKIHQSSSSFSIFARTTSLRLPKQLSVQTGQDL